MSGLIPLAECERLIRQVGSIYILVDFCPADPLGEEQFRISRDRALLLCQTLRTGMTLAGGEPIEVWAHHDADDDSLYLGRMRDGLEVSEVEGGVDPP